MFSRWNQVLGVSLWGVGVCTPAGPAIPVLSGRLLQATALSGNYYLGDKYGDKAVLACKMYEVCRHRERCTWPGNEWCEGASAAHEPPFSPCLVRLIAADHRTDIRRSSSGIIGFYLLFKLYISKKGGLNCLLHFLSRVDVRCPWLRGNNTHTTRFTVKWNNNFRWWAVT